MLKSIPIIGWVLLGMSIAARGADGPLSWGDQRDGTYRNPVLNADFSDPDVIRTGGDFWMVASDFHFMGMQVLHSTDLVNWKIVGQVFNRLTMDPKYDQMKAYGEGTWAPSIRFHNGEWFIFVCTPYDGLFMWHTRNPFGAWSDMVTVKAVKQWEDPCPFWDEDGNAYLVHSHKGAGPLILHRMSADGTTLLDDGKQIYQGKNSEGPKMYKRHGYYYISLPEGGVAAGGQVMLRSRDIYGPYERKQVLPDGSPHQGGMVELDDGSAWFISFKSAGWQGRVDYLNPVTWGLDDWPVFGDNGKSVTVWPKPFPGVMQPRIKVSDEFDGDRLDPVWQWNHNPVDANWSLAARPGWLRLTGLPADVLSHARNTLTQKLWDSAGEAVVKVDVAKLSAGQTAGLTFISGSTFNWVGVRDGQFAWTNGKGGAASGEVYFRAVYDRGVGHLAYSTDGKTFNDTGEKIAMKFLNWKGTRLGIFCFGAGNGSADFDYFHYRYGEDLTRK
jgi:beta-xylosidase